MEGGKEGRPAHRHGPLRKGKTPSPSSVSPNLNPHFSLDVVGGPASPTMTKEYQDLQHLDNEENDHQLRRGEGRRCFGRASFRLQLLSKPLPLPLVRPCRKNIAALSGEVGVWGWSSVLGRVPLTLAMPPTSQGLGEGMGP